MESSTPHPPARTILLSAGPRAGKTAQLCRWREGATGPAQYLKLTREDRVSSFLLHRFLGGWPAIAERYHRLRERMPDASWGGLLALAIVEAHPDFALFLDDFHLLEGAPDAADWVALLQHFPESGTLAVASRHQLPELGRANCARLDADDPRWREAPQRADLLALPPAVQNRLLTLHAIGEGTPCAVDDELVRRNLAGREMGGTVRLRAPWQTIANEALAFSDVPAEVWHDLEGEILAFRLRHWGSREEERLPEILDRIPPNVRRKRSALMALEGLLRQRAHRFDEARACYQRALDLAETPADRQAALLGLMDAAARLRDSEAFDHLHATLQREASPDDHALKARLLCSLGTYHWFGGSPHEAAETMRAVLSCPTEGNRQTVYYHAQALAQLAIHQIEFHHVARSPGYTERYIHLCEAYGFDRELLYTYSLSLHGLMLDEASPPPLGKLLAMPLKAFKPAQPDALCNYLLLFGIRSFFIGRYQAAKRNFEMVLSFADSLSRDEVPLIARFWLMQAHGVLGETNRVRDHYEALHTVRSRPHFWENVQLSWIRSKIFSGALDEAAELLRTIPWTVSDNRCRATLYRSWVRHLQGDEDAVQAAQTLLQSDEGAFLWHNEARVLQTLGLRSAPPLFHLSTFGETAFRRVDAPELRWPRKKALSLMAHLALNPAGLEQAELLDRLYEGSSTYDPASALYKLAYDLRKVLGPIEADELLSANRRTYRMDWSRVAHCDLHAFDALRAKAQAFEAAELRQLAGIFYWMALEEAPGALFEDLEDAAFDEPRRAYDSHIARMRTFIEAYLSPVISRVFLFQALIVSQLLRPFMEPLSAMAL
ncbi:hypothetical protein J7643_16940 [bacterium]|nr:hypothetical protein [bacterium]